MAYSRWSKECIWYTYYMVNYSTTKGGQLFDVCGVRTFKYEELLEDIEGCLEACRKYADENHKKPCTDEQIKELKGYMQEFMEDVERDLELIAIEKLKKAPDLEVPLLISAYKSSRYEQCFCLRAKGEPIPDELFE
jgi:hypothetical protein